MFPPDTEDSVFSICVAQKCSKLGVSDAMDVRACI